MKLPRLETSVSSGTHNYKETTVVSHHEDYSVGQTTGGLSVLFTILCIVDLFGVFPVIALPKSVISCGIYGLPLVVSVFGLQLYTAVLLGRCWLLAQEITPDIQEKRRLPYAAVAELAFGVPARSLVTFLIDAAVFGAGVPNFILASQSMQLFWWKISGGEIGITYCVWMLIIGLLLCPVMWLGSPKDMKPLAVSSVIIVSTVAICTWTCIALDDESPPSRGGLLQYQPSVEDFLIAYGIIAFQFDIHPLLLTIQVDMKDSRKINTAVLGGFSITITMFAVTTLKLFMTWFLQEVFDIHPLLLTIQVDMKDSRKINTAVLGGFSITITMFAVTTLLAAYRYGGDINSNILQGIPPSYPLYVVALLVTVQLCLSSAVGNSALFQHVEELLKIPKDFCIQRCLLRSSIVAVAVFLGESVPRFDLVMGLIGSTLTGPLMFILPPLFFLKLCFMKINLVNKIPYNKLTSHTQNGDSNLHHNGGANTTQNGGHTSENGASSQLLVPYLTTYETFTNYTRIGGDVDEYTIKWYDVMLALIVMLMGIAATIVATYSSWADTIQYATFTPPCLVNATAAARSFLVHQARF